MARGQSQSSSKSAQRLPYIFGSDGRAIILNDVLPISREEFNDASIRDEAERVQKQSDYWKKVEANIVEKDEGGESITQGARTKEVAGMDIVDKKKYILADIQKAQKEGMFDNLYENTDPQYSGVKGMKFGGTISRFAGGSSLEITAKIPIDSPFGRAYDKFSNAMKGASSKERDEIITEYRKYYGKAQNELKERINQSVEQFNYTRMGMGYNESYATNFYFSTSVSIVDKKGKEVHSIINI